MPLVASGLGFDFGPAIQVALTVAQDAFQAYLQFQASGRQDEIAAAQVKLAQAQQQVANLQAQQAAQGGLNQQIGASVGLSSSSVTLVEVGLGLLALVFLLRR